MGCLMSFKHLVPVVSPVAALTYIFFFPMPAPPFITCLQAGISCMGVSPDSKKASCHLDRTQMLY